MSRPKTVGEIPVGGGGGAPWWLVVLLIAAAGAGFWYWKNRVVDARIDAANERARSDSLKLALTAGEIRVWERRAVIAENEAELAEALGEELAAEVRRRGEEVRAAHHVVAELRDSVEIDAEVQPPAGGETHVTAHHEDAVFRVDVDMAIAGTVDPPDAPATATIDIGARLELDVAVTCDEEGDPHAYAQAIDSRVSVVEMRSTVAEGVSCVGGRAPELLSLKPTVTIGNGLLAAGAFTLGLLLGR